VGALLSARRRVWPSPARIASMPWRSRRNDSWE
jgi:hypothetical protein